MGLTLDQAFGPMILESFGRACILANLDTPLNRKGSFTESGDFTADGIAHFPTRSVISQLSLICKLALCESDCRLTLPVLTPRL